jgi:hypothetical protein
MEDYFAKTIKGKCKTYARGGQFGDRHSTVDPPLSAPLGL